MIIATENNEKINNNYKNLPLTDLSFINASPRSVEGRSLMLPRKLFSGRVESHRLVRFIRQCARMHNAKYSGEYFIPYAERSSGPEFRALTTPMKNGREHRGNSRIRTRRKMQITPYAQKCIL